MPIGTGTAVQKAIFKRLFLKCLRNRCDKGAFPACLTIPSLRKAKDPIRPGLGGKSGPVLA